MEKARVNSIRPVVSKPKNGPNLQPHYDVWAFEENADIGWSDEWAFQDTYYTLKEAEKAMNKIAGPAMIFVLTFPHPDDC